MSETWRYRLLGEEFGPVSMLALRELLRSGDLAPSDEVAPGDGDWLRASDFPDLLADVDPPSGDAIPLDDGLAAMLDQVSQADSVASSAITPNREGWYVRILHSELGPLDWDRLSAMAAEGGISETDEIREGARGNWQRAGDVIGLFSESADENEQSRESSAGADAADVWYHELKGLRSPISWEQLRALVATGKLGMRDRLREGAQGRWVRAATVVGLFADQMHSRTWAGHAEVSARTSESAETSPQPDGAAETPEAADPPNSGAAAPPPGNRDSSTPDAAGAVAEEQSASAPKDQWSAFFDKVEDRERKKWRRDQKPASRVPQPVAAPMKPPPAAAPPAASIAPPVAPTPQPAPVSPSAALSQSRSTPSFAASPRRKRSFSLPTIDLSGLFQKFQGGGGGTGKKLLIPLALGAAVLAFQYLPGLIAGTPGKEDYHKLAAQWQKALQLKETKAPADAWTAFKAEVLPVIDEMQSRLAPEVESRGKDVPIAQRILWMVDVEDGPTNAPGYFRKVLEAGPTAKETDFTNGSAVMSEAASYAGAP